MGENTGHCLDAYSQPMTVCFSMCLPQNHEMVVQMFFFWLVNGNKKFTSLSTRIGRGGWGRYQVPLIGRKEVAHGVVVGPLLAWASLPQVEGVGEQRCREGEPPQPRQRLLQWQSRRQCVAALTDGETIWAAAVSVSCLNRRHGSYQLANTQGAMCGRSPCFPTCLATCIARLLMYTADASSCFRHPFWCECQQALTISS